MTARDGVVLRADVYRPDGPGRFPVLLSRLPYDKNGRRRPGDIDVFVEHGYVVISSSNFPRFDRNLNTGEDQATGTRWQTPADDLPRRPLPVASHAARHPALTTKEPAMTSPLVTYAVDGRVGVVSLNRGDKLNAISGDLKRTLVERFHEADGDPATSVVILRAEGRSFCAGYDISPNPARAARKGNTLAWHESLTDDVALEMTPWDMKKPVVAAVQGHCLGGGCELAMMCDITIAADDAVFGEPEIRFSNVGPALIMPFVIGQKRARELLYLGDTIDAPTALQYGMVNRVVPRAELDAAALKFARRMALIAPEALAGTKLALNRGADAAGFRNAIRAGLDMVAPLYAARTEVGTKFDEIREKDGLGAALRWRGAQFAE